MLPFDASAQLISHLDEPGKTKCLPGYPNIDLADPTRLKAFLSRDLNLRDLEQLAPKLWMMSAHNSANISPLHRQKVKSREIVVTEDPRLHLVWYYERIFIKPLPKYLLSAAFWQQHLGQDPYLEAERRAALGYLRTYTYLIRHESDFRIARSEDLCLVPDGVSWEQFCAFAARLSSIPDSEVAGRYEYGEIRLTRLNFYCKIFLGKQSFHRVHSQYGEYFGSLFAPLLFIFGVLSVILSAMQVELATEALLSTDVVSEQWQTIWDVCRYFSVVTLVAIAILLAWLLWLLLYKFTKEWNHALQHRYRSKRI